MHEHADRDHTEPRWVLDDGDTGRALLDPTILDPDLGDAGSAPGGIPLHEAPSTRDAQPTVPSERRGLSEYLDELRAGADPTSVPENAWPTAGQLWHQLLTVPVDERLDRLSRLLDNAAQHLSQQAAHDRLVARNLEMAERHAEHLHNATQRAEAAEAAVARVHHVVDGKAGGFAQAVRAALAVPAKLEGGGCGLVWSTNGSACPDCREPNVHHAGCPRATEGGA